MKKTLSEYFRENSGAPIAIDGREIVPAKIVVLSKGSYELEIKIQASGFCVDQGLILSPHKGFVRGNGFKTRKSALWSSTAPPCVTLIVDMTRDGELLLWNVWKETGVTQAWVRDAGLYSVEEGDGFTLHCSGPSVGVNFSDFTAKVRLRRL